MTSHRGHGDPPGSSWPLLAPTLPAARIRPYRSPSRRRSWTLPDCMAIRSNLTSSTSNGSAAVADRSRCTRLGRALPAVRRPRILFGIVVAIGLLLSSASIPPTSLAQGGSPVPSIAARNRAFLAAVDSAGPDGILEFFPSEGHFTYVHTVHQMSGDHRRVWRFPAEQKGDVLVKGPLSASFEFHTENQIFGLLAHQIVMRGAQWHRVSGTRFVPRGETAASAIFIEWRREGSKWVVSSFGDESFSRLPLPRWMIWRDRKPPGRGHGAGADGQRLALERRGAPHRLVRPCRTRRAPTR